MSALDAQPADDLLDGAWFTTEELARMLGVDPSPLRRWRTARPRKGPPFVCLSSRVTLYSAQDVRRHDLRHTGLTWMADAGVPVHVLRKIAGHGSLVTTQRYLHPGAQSITDAGTALSAHLSARWSPNGPQLRLVKDT